MIYGDVTMKKITILALHLGYGGIERCISNLSNSLVEDYKIEIISTYKLYDKPPFYFDKRIKIKYLIDRGPNRKEIKEALRKFRLVTFIKELFKAKKLLKLKKELMIDYIKKCKSDIIISTRDIHNEWLGKYGNSKSIKIGWEHNHHNNNHKYIKKIVDSTNGLDYFVLVSKELKEFYETMVSCKCVYIPNSIMSLPNKLSKLDSNNIVSVGRLSSEKGYLDLIDVFKLVVDNCDAKLNIIGDGVEKDKIIDKIKKYNLENKVLLHGYQSAEYIEKVFLDSSIYVMTSFTESFGLVVLEASSYGIPCIAFDSAHGVRELIKDNWDGYLVEDRDKVKMAKRIINLINDQNRRLIMGDNAYKKSHNYLASNIKNEWIKIFEKK